MKPQLQRITATLEKLDQQTQVSSVHPSFAINSQNFTSKKNKTSNLCLPKIKSIPLSNHRNAANPALARNILKEIDTKIATWQDKLTKIQKEIQALYLEGPIVDGWLESHIQSWETEETRKTYNEQFKNYVEEINTGEVSYQSPKAGYRLCGLDEQGKLWSKECPQGEVGELSMAIARYHKLKQLLNQKRTLETKLQQLAETLVILHSNITGNITSN